jgi:hypothetical protein
VIHACNPMLQPHTVLSLLLPQVLTVRANFFNGSLDLTSCKELLLLDLMVWPARQSAHVIWAACG